MDAIMLNKSILKEDAQTINCCRLYLQVECLSDIATDGRNVDQSIFNKNEPMTTSRSHLVWPQQEKPGPKAWKIWIRIIKQMFCKNGGYQLITPLGQWTNTKNRTWDTYYDKDSKLIAIRHGKGWDYHKHDMARKRLRHILHNRPEYHKADEPSNHEPLIREADTKVILVSEPTDTEIDPVESGAVQHKRTCETFISLLEPWETDLLRNVHYHNNDKKSNTQVKYSVNVCERRGSTQRTRIIRMGDSTQKESDNTRNGSS